MRAELSWTVRPIRAADWTAVAELEHRAYAPLGLSEGGAALEALAAASPATCFVATADQDSGPAEVAGYLLALPCPPLAVPELGRPAAARPEGATVNLHLHDAVVAAPLRGHGVASALLARLEAVAGPAGYDRISLVAVGGAEGFWQRRGFRAHPDVRPPEHYGPDARYMSRPVNCPARQPA